MPCVTPIKAYRFLNRIPRGYKEVSLRFPPVNMSLSDYKEVMLPCGKCIECKRRYTREWALRMSVECQMHDQNSFLTLTYDDDHVPRSRSGLPTLRYKDVQDFMKRLRKFFDTEQKKFQRKGINYVKPKVSYYYCGEYGSLTQRPHYHMILFGWFPPVLERCVFNGVENTVFESAVLEKIWKNGRVQVQTVNFDACAYVAGYVQKKQKHWNDYQKGLFYGDRAEEKSYCSRRPAIGKRWYSRYKNDIFPADRFVSNGVELPVPNYFYRQLIKDCNFNLNNDKDLQKYEFVRKHRLENLQDYTPEHLFARKRICESKEKLRKERNGGL